MEKLISAKPCVWDVTEKYLRKNDNSMLKELRAIPLSTVQVSKKFVSINGDEPKVYMLGAKGEYYRNGIPLTSVLQVAANAGNSKVKIF